MTGSVAVAPERLEQTRSVGPARGGREWPAVVCGLAYAGLAVAYYGPGNPFDASQVAGPHGADQTIQIWWLEWAEFALAHGHNPLFSNWLNTPVGMNAGVNGSMLALGSLFAPVTAHFGPVVTWNLLVRLAPVVSALSMCLVLRRWTTWWPAAFLGGLGYGFSAYQASQVSSYLFLTFLPLPPLLFLLLDEILARQRWRPTRTGVALGVLCAVQFLISSEVFTSMLLLAAVAAALYLGATRASVRAKLPYLGQALRGAVIAGGLLLVVPVGFTLLGPEAISGVPNSPSALARMPGDLLGTVVPGFFQRFSTSGTRTYWDVHLQHSVIMYLGLPLCIAMVVTTAALRRRGIVRLVAAMTAISFVLSLGSVLYVGGRDTHVPLPFVVLAHLPLTEGLLASRFSLFTAMFGSALVAFGVEALYARIRRAPLLQSWSPAARSAGASGVVVVVAAIVVLPLAPTFRQPVSATAVSPFFTSNRTVGGAPPGGVVLTYPYADAPLFPGAPGYSFAPRYQAVNDALLAQAVAGIPFKLIGSYGWRPSGGGNGTPAPSLLHPKTVKDFFDLAFYGVPVRPHQCAMLARSNFDGDLRTFLRLHGVKTVLVLPVGQRPGAVRAAVTAAIGPPVEIDGVAAWNDVRQRLRMLPSPGHGVTLAGCPAARGHAVA